MNLEPGYKRKVFHIKKNAHIITIQGIGGGVGVGWWRVRCWGCGHISYQQKLI